MSDASSLRKGNPRRWVEFLSDSHKPRQELQNTSVQRARDFNLFMYSRRLGSPKDRVPIAHAPMTKCSTSFHRHPTWGYQRPYPQRNEAQRHWYPVQRDSHSQKDVPWEAYPRPAFRSPPVQLFSRRNGEYFFRAASLQQIEPMICL